MALAKIKQLRGTGVYVPGDDLDTDRIIPARFMKCVTFDGLGEYAFYDARFDEDGNSKGHPLDAPSHKGASILISGKNFGCGSSREHAPQSLYHFGLRAVLAESFAEIFFGNCTTLGIPCAVLSATDREALAQAVDANPKLEIEIDLEKSEVRFGERKMQFNMPESARAALAGGQWDPLSQLLEAKEQVAAVESALPYRFA
ncbi:MAG: 3-isopropylmalate dehydratase small subunit [Candidatus Omnitrophica bacterium]|nr:3-isopropylmalate dehydratase small subunit [Candidatus Omnitrophota bacterium]